MAEKRKGQDKKTKDTPVTVALIGAGATIIAAFIGILSLWLRPEIPNSTIPNNDFISTATITSILTPAPCIENDFNDENQTKINWNIESTSSYAGHQKTSLENGKYIWSMNATTPVLFPNELILSRGVITQNRDYELNVEIEKIKGLDSVRYGIVLNHVADLKFYRILISPYKRQLSVSKRTPSEYLILLQNTTISTINQNGVNKLTVIKKGSIYQIYINDELGGEFTDVEYSSGSIRLATEITEVNSDVILQIDNFRLCNLQ